MAETAQATAPTVQVERSMDVIDALKVAYSMELETVCNYLSNSVNLDGIRAQAIKNALKDDISSELRHAQKLAKRLHILGAIVPGSQEITLCQTTLQPKLDLTDVVSVIRGVIDAENAACMQYRKLIELCEGLDYVTQELCIEFLADEEEHRREFTGFLKEYEKCK